MIHFDVFNGDADGICALQQLRLATPRKAPLVTGGKRNIVLLAHVPAVAGDEVTVLNLSLDRNRKALLGLLENGVHVRYFDHHFPGPIPEHPGLDAHIETLPDRGVSLLVDDFLGGRFQTWVVVGTFGDSFDATARWVADPLELNAAQLATLRELGICLNYNAYGAYIQNLYFAPDVLFRRLEPYANPFDFIAADTAFETLRTGYAEDMARTRGLQPELMDDRYALYILPADPWARRAGGVLDNRLAHTSAQRAYALLARGCRKADSWSACEHLRRWEQAPTPCVVASRTAVAARPLPASITSAAPITTNSSNNSSPPSGNLEKALP